jgi:YD repeat-containing protein
MKRTFVVIALVLSLAGSAIAATVEYTYDEIGRLVGVYAPNGDAAQYVYL